MATFGGLLRFLTPSCLGPIRDLSFDVEQNSSTARPCAGSSGRNTRGSAMKRFVAATVVLALAGLINSVHAADPTGTWKSTSKLGGQNFESTLKLRLDSEGSRLTGAYIRGPVSEASPLASTNYKNGQISFSVNCEVDGQRLTIKYSGTLTGDTITGSSQFEQGEQVYTSDWIATRQK